MTQSSLTCIWLNSRSRFETISLLVYNIGEVLRMNLNKEKNNQRLIQLKICKDYQMFLALDPIFYLRDILLSLELQRSFNSSTIELHVKMEFDISVFLKDHIL
ncbi:hypothetical protein BpHYR1_049885 [Brachionus plicatilis]|uniref:Uncharacterized protein n=1 Tax=Brachionus plicatilis TaxID=10195 RepID=A0A3M7QG96_BRAPC|nr:hypothetical protein BpHYR1_049885 [Brachionus plicatilis]